MSVTSGVVGCGVVVVCMSVAVGAVNGFGVVDRLFDASGVVSIVGVVVSLPVTESPNNEFGFVC